MEEEKTEKTYFLFVGNPGSGKSTTANTALGECRFPSGLAGDGASLTKTHQVVACKELRGYVIDAPGLADAKNRAARAAEIEQAFKQNGIYKVFFVLRPTDGRLNEQDVTTMKSIVLAVPTMKYSVILTQVCSGVEMESARGQIRDLLELLFPQIANVDRAFHIIPEIEAARKKENVLLPTEHQVLLRTFLLNAPESKVVEKDVGTIKSTEKELEDLRDQLRHQQEEAKIAIAEHKDEIKGLVDKQQVLQENIKEQMVIIERTQARTKDQEKLITSLQDQSKKLERDLEAARKRRRRGFLAKLVDAVVGF